MNMRAAYFQGGAPKEDAWRTKTAEELAIRMSKAGELKRMAPRRDADTGQIAVVVHGLFMYGHFMLPLGGRLAAGGYETLIYDYPTRKNGIEGHAGRFADFLKELSSRSSKRINIVTHSLGGVVARVALAKMLNGDRSEGRPLGEQLGRVVMLAPPNRGSDVARLLSRLPFIASLAKPIPELSSEPGSLIHRLPSPEGVDIGIIAGKHDIEVAVGYTHMPGERTHAVIASDHSFMPFRRDVAQMVLRYLEKGEFHGAPE